MPLQRRHFLSLGASLPLAAYLGHARAAAPAPEAPRMLLVFLRGAYDSNSLLVPTHSDFYYESRPTIAIPQPGELNGALPVDARWGLHPALQGSLLPLVQKKQACFVPFAGTNDLSRSHFETQDSIELGQPLEGKRDFHSGFLNRLAQVLQHDSRKIANVAPMAFTSQLPMSLRGPARTANMALASVGKPGNDAGRSKVITAMYAGSPLAEPVREGFEVRDAVQRGVQEEMDRAGRDAISAKGFSLVAQRMAGLMREQFDLGFVDIGGWDTHVNQGGVSGNLANRLDDLGRGLAIFAESIGPEAWRSTTVAVISEFGRTFRENGNKGTDHGHGTTYWIMGGGLSAQAGGKVVGEQVEVNQAALFQNRDYPVLNEYRSVLGGLFAQMYGLSAAQVNTIFPNAQVNSKLTLL